MGKKKNTEKRQGELCVLPLKIQNLNDPLMWPPATPSYTCISLMNVQPSLSMAMTGPTNSKLLSECLSHRLLNLVLLPNSWLCLVLSMLVSYHERKSKILIILVILKAPPPFLAYEEPLHLLQGK